MMDGTHPPHPPKGRPSARARILWCCCVLAWHWAPGALEAHRLNNSRTAVRVTEDSLRLELAVDESDLALAFALDRNGDGVLWRSEMLAGIPEVAEYVAARLQVEADGEPVALVRQAVYVDPDNQGNLYLNLRFGAGLTEPPSTLDLYVELFERFSEGHKNLATVSAYGGEPQPAVFSTAARHRRFVLREAPFCAIPGGIAAVAAAVAMAGVLTAVGLRRRRRRGPV